MIRQAAGLLLLPLFVRAIQPSAKEPQPNQEIRDLEWGDINFLHGWHAGHLQEPQYSADLGDYISFTAHMRSLADARGVDLLVVDTGDRAEGNGLWDVSDPKGRYTRKVIQQLNLDLLTSGNHELYNDTTALFERTQMVPAFQGRYLSSNIDINITGSWEPFAARSMKFTTPKMGLNITAFGFLFNFTDGANNTRVTPVSEAVQQPWFTEAVVDSEVDLFLVLAHIDTDSPELRQVHDAIRAVHLHTPIQFFAGHAHQRKFKVIDDKSSALESGRYCETVGWLSLSGLGGDVKPTNGGGLKTSRKYIDFNRASFQHHSNTTLDTFDTPAGLNVTRDITEYRLLLDLDRLIGCSPQDFTLSKSPYPSSDNWYSFLATTLLPEMVRNPHRDEIPHMIFINTGSQRFDVFCGPFTYDTSFLVSPFTSRFNYVTEIPWDVADQLLDIFLKDPSPFSIESPLLLEPVCGDSTWPAPQPRDQMPLTSGWKTIIPGHTTHDDFGDDGDDTAHTGWPRYAAPKVIQANASFPPDWETQPPTVVDVVFFDFIAGHVAEALNKITGGKEAQSGKRNLWKKEEFERYMGEGDTLTKLLLQFVERNWRHDCV